MAGHDGRIPGWRLPAQSAAVGCGMLLTYLLLSPSPLSFLGTAGGGLERTADAVLTGFVQHLTAYTIWTVLLLLGFGAPGRDRSIGAAAAGHGLLMECGQMFVPHREFDWLDVLANAGGVLVAVTGVWLMGGRRR